MTMLSSTSRLIELVTSGKHNKVKVEGEDLQRLMAWVDCNWSIAATRRSADSRSPASDRQQLPVPVKTCTAPKIDRLQPVTDPVAAGAK